MSSFDAWMSQLGPSEYLSRGASGMILEPSPEELNADLEVICEGVRGNCQRYYLEEAKRAFDAGAKYGSFIILCAFMHNLASHMHSGSINGEEFRGFCEKYLSAYNSHSLWENFRCAIFHRGVPSIGGDSAGVVLTSDDASHDPKGERNIHKGCITIAFGPLWNDLTAAMQALLRDASSDSKLEDRLRYTYNYYRVVEGK